MTLVAQYTDCPLQLIVFFANYLIHILSFLPIVPSTHSPSITCPVFSSNMSSFAGTLDGVMDKRPESGSLNLQQQAGSQSRNDPGKLLHCHITRTTRSFFLFLDVSHTRNCWPPLLKSAFASLSQQDPGSLRQLTSLLPVSL